MPKVKDNEKLINLKISENLKYQLKLRAVKEKTSMQKLILKLIEDYCQKKTLLESFETAPYEDEELSEEELQAMEESRRDIEEGKTLSLEQYIEGKRI